MKLDTYTIFFPDECRDSDDTESIAESERTTAYATIDVVEYEIATTSESEMDNASFCTESSATGSDVMLKINGAQEPKLSTVSFSLSFYITKNMLFLKLIKNRRYTSTLSTTSPYKHFVRIHHRLVISTSTQTRNFP